MLIKVIGAGVGRTGTRSLQLALQILGFKSYHMFEVVNHHPEHADLWIKKIDGKKVDWQDIFKEYDACVDYPACAFYKELIACYPDAKVILTVRDPDSWHASCLNTIYEFSNGWAASIMACVSPFFRKMRKLTNMLIWDGYYQGKFEDAAFAKDKYLKWNEEVKAVVPKEKLLVFEVKQGWEPLCKFLGVPIPSEPFPRVNDTSEIRKTINGMRMAALAVPMGGALLVAAAGVAIKYYFGHKLF